MIPNKYKIKRLETDELKPEETLADAISFHPTMETPISRRVFGVFYVFVVGALLFLVFKSFQLQLLDGDKYATLANQSSSLNYQLSPLRGIIYDSQGSPMVENIPVFDLVAVHNYLPQNQAEINEEIEHLSSVLGVDPGGLRKLFEDNKDRAVFLIKKNLSKEEMAKVKALSLAGIFAVANAQRRYADGPASAHLVGYTSQITADDLEGDNYYFLNDRIGRLGLEAQYEEYLRGQRRSFDFKQNETADSKNENMAGQNIFLNIDVRIQAQLYKSVSLVFASAGVRRGAAVIQNAKTGAVLGLISMPSFDNNIFENSTEPANSVKISNLLANTEHPLLNRVISGRYSPGSTIKPLLALAGLKEGVVTPSTIIFANGSISVQSEVDPSVYYTFRDWKVHGWTDIKKAIADSVDVYFYALGGGYGGIKGLGIDRIASYLKSAGADDITGIDLPGEISGLVPSKDWKMETKGEAWYTGDTYNISIGQGDLGVTPLWINSYVGAIANGGSLMKPFVVKEIKDAGDKITKQFLPHLLTKLPFDSNTLNIVKQGMRQTVLSGTATMLQDVPVPLAAKTGTVQITGRGLNSLFAVFGPYDDPEIVMTVLVENISQSQGLAIRVANDFLLWYFNDYKKNGGY
mgnify:CR=1 FL=1